MRRREAGRQGGREGGKVGVHRREDAPQRRSEPIRILLLVEEGDAYGADAHSPPVVRAGLPPLGGVFRQEAVEDAAAEFRAAALREAGIDAVV